MQHPFKRRQNTSNRYIGAAGEKKFAKEFSGTLTKNSGATSSPSQKGDVHVEDFLVEKKVTQKQSYTLKLKDLVKLCDQANFSNRVPVFVIEFMNEQLFPPHVEEEWVMVPKSFFHNIKETHGQATSKGKRAMSGTRI